MNHVHVIRRAIPAIAEGNGSLFHAPGSNAHPLLVEIEDADCPSPLSSVSPLSVSSDTAGDGKNTDSR